MQTKKVAFGGLMTRIFPHFVTRLVLAVLLFAQIGVSQQVTQTMNVHVPFSFLLGNKTFAAGNYQIRSIGRDRIALYDSHLHFLAYAMTNNIASRSVPRLPSAEFLKSGENYALIRIWNANDSVGHELSQTKSPHVSSNGELATKNVRINGIPQ